MAEPALPCTLERLLGALLRLFSELILLDRLARLGAFAGLLVRPFDLRGTTKETQAGPPSWRDYPSMVARRWCGGNGKGSLAAYFAGMSFRRRERREDVLSSPMETP